MKSFFPLQRAIGVFQALRREVRFRQNLVKLSGTLPQVIVVGSGAEGEGKSALIYGRSGNFLINCPEPTSVVTGFIGNGNKVTNLLLTRPHWDNVAGLSSFLHIYYVNQDRRHRLKVFGIKEPKMFASHPNNSQKYIKFFPIEKQFTTNGITVQCFELNGKHDHQSTIAFLMHLENHAKESKDTEQVVEHQAKKNPRRASSILVLEVLNEAHIRSFLSNPSLMNALHDNPPRVALHFSARRLQHEAAFQGLVDSLPSSCQHIFLDAVQPSYLSPVWLRRHVVQHFFQNRKTYPLPSTLQSPLTKAKPGEVWRDLSSNDWTQLSAHVDNMRQTIFDRRLTPHQVSKYPGGFNGVSPPLLPPAAPCPAPIGRPNCWSAHSLLTYHLENGAWTDILDLTRDASRLLASTLARNFHCQIGDIKKRAEQLGRTIKEDIKSGVLPPTSSEYPKLIFLGTGSAFPTQHRNVTGIILCVDEENSVLLDCGVGTLARMYAFLGPKGAQKILRTLKAVCITHDHLDHYEGILTLIMEWLNVNEDNSKLRVLANNLVLNQVNGNIAKFCPTLNHKRVNMMELRRPGKLLLRPIQGLAVEFTTVNHKFLAFAFSFRHIDGWHVVFSGDTMPCSSMLHLGHDCDLLIHEATIEDHNEDLAIKTKHSTVSQAISMARKMKAKRVVLTHFSQRSEKFPVSLTELPDHFVAASDGLQLSLDDVYYFRGDQVKTLANFVTYSFSIGNYQFFSETPTFFHPPRPVEGQIVLD